MTTFTDEMNNDRLYYRIETDKARKGRARDTHAESPLVIRRILRYAVDRAILRESHRRLDVIMKRVFFYSLLFVVLENVRCAPSCKSIIDRRSANIDFRCTELNELRSYLDRAKSNTTRISVTDSNIPTVQDHTFVRFSPTLVKLDLHGCKIQTIDAQAFIGLTKLEELLLWGNELTWLPYSWFMNTYNLRTLDVSFNSIQGIDFYVYQSLPLLEKFYFDYNQLSVIDYSMFEFMKNLKKVKFGKNPWRWPYRARLSWQMENQKVDYADNWEDWSWMNSAVRDCVETGQSDTMGDKILDCVVGKLLDFTRAYWRPTQVDMPDDLRCHSEARALIGCTRSRNGTGNNDLETVRIILEDYSAIFMPMERTRTPFVVKPQKPLF